MQKIISAKQCIEEDRAEREQLKIVLNKAEQIARKAHKGQKRKDGKPYITHPKAVASACSDVKCKIVAWLHDVLEDTPIHPNELEDKGIPKELVKQVVYISRLDGEDYKDYILQVKKNEIARLVKIQDLKHNLSDLKPGNMRDKYLLALYILEEMR